MKVTERDVGLIRRINAHGFMSVDQIASFWRVDFSTAARRVRKLIEAGLLHRMTMPFLDARPLVATPTGCNLAGDHIPHVAGIRTGTFRHDALLPDLGLSLERKFSAAFETERQIKMRIGKAPHLPDGILHMPGGRKVAIELELTQKARRRLARIMDFHAANLEIDAVWYVVLDEAMRAFLQRATIDHPHIKIVKWTPPSDATRVSGGIVPHQGTP
ncbi:MarR family transcriptional regulator [Devosia sp. D6-9]|nr:MarR family transcriptional regulator [Devosia sp. D6-9]